MNKQNITVSGVWLTPKEVPGSALFMQWRIKKNKFPVLFDMYSPSRNTGLFRYVSGDSEELQWGEVEYLHEGTITPELAKEIAEQVYPMQNNNWIDTTRIEFQREAYALALTSLIVSEN